MKGVAKTGLISTTAAVKIREHQHEGCHSAHQHENASCAANTFTDTAVVDMDRAVVDVSDFLATGNFGWSFLIS
ncbi:transcriptional regulator [Salmonella enterica subsp. enterica]|uniref:Transcriptional regulator n=1 Tax=Salmonella enterica I TaxID=59201 RepID=A0A379W2C9_SALET|nr:transcriptional regulator [Salmonella enterica subsp. enterica]